MKYSKVSNESINNQCMQLLVLHRLEISQLELRGIEEDVALDFVPLPLEHKLIAVPGSIKRLRRAEKVEQLRRSQ